MGLHGAKILSHPIDNAKEKTAGNWQIAPQLGGTCAYFKGPMDQHAFTMGKLGHGTYLALLVLVLASDRFDNC